MSNLDTLNDKIIADREAGRDIPLVIEELLQMVVQFFAEPANEEASTDKEPASKPAATVDEEKAADPISEPAADPVEKPAAEPATEPVAPISPSNI